MGLPVAVHILGVNQTGQEGSNAAACQGKDIPWLQEVPTELVWSSWKVTYRDVVILDEKNQTAAIYNLSAHNLADSTAYHELKAMLTALGGGK